MHKQFQEYNPFRDPQWRYERCLKLVEHRPRPLPASPQRDDIYVRRYRKFLLRFLRCRTEDEQNELFPLDPPLFYAHSLHHNPDREWRAMLQARLLTGESDEYIAGCTGTLPEAIMLYEQLFFNVRDRLDNKDWVVKTVLGTATSRAANRYDTMTEHQRDSLYKLFGYYGGPVILDVIISGFAARDMPTNTKNIGSWFDRTMKTLVRRKATMEAQRFEVDKFKVMELMHVHLSILASEKDTGGGNSDTTKMVEVLLQQTPWGLAKKGYQSLNEQQQHYSITHVEPRADEQMQLAFGQIPATLIERNQSTAVKLLNVSQQPED